MNDSLKTRWARWPWPGASGLALALALGLALPLGAAQGTSAKTQTQNPPANLNIDDSPPPRDARAGLSFAPVVKKVAPSVVNIYSTTTVHERGLPGTLFNDPLLRRFFGEHFGMNDQPRSHQEQGLGSGVIVSADGYILTANHIVNGADTVKVALATGEQEFDAKVIGTDPATDVAVLRIESRKPLPAITLGDSDKLEVGDVVLALGNPFAVGQTVTMGIVSGLGRGGFGTTGYEDFIQTDAAINPGNSGGALVDSQGRLVGINTAILTRSGGYQGVGFAVPINMARFVMDMLIREGRVTRGFLGVYLQTLTPALARNLDLPEDTTGVLVGGVNQNSPAEKAGIQNGDVITELNGRKMSERRNLRLLVAQTPPGTKVTLRLLRARPGHEPAQHTLTAKLGELPSEALAAMGGAHPAPKPRGQSKLDALNGVEVTDLDARVRRQFDLPATLRGALVVSVEQDSNAAEAGLHPGNVLLEIDKQPVADADAAIRLSDKAKGEQMLLRVWSGAEDGGSAGTRYLVVDNIKHK